VVLHLRAQGLEEEDEHPPPLRSCGAWLTFTFYTELTLYYFITKEVVFISICLFEGLHKNYSTDGRWHMGYSKKKR